MQTRKTIVNVSLVLVGIMGFIVLLLPWYELSAKSYISGYGSSGASGGTQLGLVSAGLSIFGYALYALPAVCIGLGAGLIKKELPARSKAFLVEFIGIGEVICWLLLKNEMSGYSSSISGSGYSASAGFEALPGCYVAFAAYLITGFVGFIMAIVAPKEPVQPDNSQTSV